MTKPEIQSNCPLCITSSESFCSDRNRDYLRCPNCDLIFVPQECRLDPDEEKSRYDLHQNDPADSGYRCFLNRLFQPLERKLDAGSSGLDFGCGPGPTLSLMFEEAGYNCSVYDIFYAKDPSVFNERYDFITCSETMEHMHHPGEEFQQLVNLVKPDGWIGIMTQLHDQAPVPFECWHYKDDDTHVCFFSRKTFQTLKKNYGLHLEFHTGNVILFQRRAC